ncbi:hypothetical protein CEXT_200051 [Caerostris extrusa]|uniref:Uncharacterized protein n=1 Tax=Caerostris extrusa TaxID=172846 RepID=A0AAV4RJ43_CAEEX|nr:hypothetical protein CEXT_200051 [Caerostris extrusa]
MESVVRNDSLSSDQSESVRPPPPKPHKNKRGKKLRQRSVSSSEDDLQSTPALAAKKLTQRVKVLARKTFSNTFS